ncbi:MAG: EAL domain-containing protein [Gammaproteobacteria bacterium]|nr:EAL domain-containing protein [Gammaproteobacteria bacterium]
MSLLVPLVVVPLLIIGRVAYTELRDSAEIKTFNQIAGSLERQKQLMATKIRTAAANVELFSNANLVKKYFLIGDEMERYNLLQRPLLRVFKAYQAAYPEYYEIRVLMPDGYEDARWTRNAMDNVTEEEAESPFFHAMTNWPKDIYTSVLRNPDNSAISLLTAKRVLMKDDSLDATTTNPVLRGYLALTVSLDDLRQAVQNQKIGEQGFYVATNPDGEVLFQPAEYSLDRLMPELDPSALIRGVLSGTRFETHFQGQATYVEGIQLHRDLYMFAVLPEEQLLKSSTALGYTVAVITTIAIVITITALFTALHYIVLRPIRILGKATHDIGRGELSINIDTRTKDEIGELAVSFKEMSENLKESNEHIQFLAYHDSLTGLPNRPMFQDYLGRAISQAARTGELLAVLFLDLDNFKRINDTLGHHIGDSLLQRFAEYLTKELREEDYLSRPTESDPDHVVARFGGDEFIVLLRNLKDQFAAGTVAKRICDLLKHPFVISGYDLYTSTSIGITIYPVDATDANDIVKNADAAMYHAKEQGRNNYQYYAESMNLASTQRLHMESKLRKALEHRMFELHYQPKVDTQTHQIIGAEALIRWRDPELGMVRPDIFIPIAEETGLIAPIGEWVMNSACIQAKEWQDAGLPDISISVNVSAVQVARQNLSFMIERSLTNSRLDAKYLDIEITESAIMTAEDRAVKVLTETRALGVSVSLDDFGTGYSSLSYLRKFPISNLKIDRSFISELSRDHSSESIVTAIIAMAHSLDLQVTAEGVEDDHQLRFLSERKCNFIQGYLFSRPLPAEDFAALLNQGDLKIA